jgi:hypothetical protein
VTIVLFYQETMFLIAAFAISDKSYLKKEGGPLFQGRLPS